MSESVVAMDGGIRFETRRERYMKNLREAVKKACFSTLYLITRSNGLYQSLAVFGLFFDFFQLLGFLIVAIDWGIDLDWYNIITLSIDKTSSSAFGTAMAVVSVLIWVLIILSGYTATMIYMNNGVLSEIYLLRILRLLAGLMIPVLFIPSVKMYAATFKCSGEHWDIFPEEEMTCFQSRHIGLFVGSLVTVIVFILFSTFVGFMVFDSSPRSTNILSRHNSRAEGGYVLFKVILSLSTVTQEPTVPVVLLGVGSLIFFLMFFTFPPYFRRVPNAIRGSLFGSFFLGSTYVVILKIIDKHGGGLGGEGTRNTLFSVLLVIMFFGTIACGLVVNLHIKRTTHVAVNELERIKRYSPEFKPTLAVTSKPKERRGRRMVLRDKAKAPLVDSAASDSSDSSTKLPGAVEVDDDGNRVKGIHPNQNSSDSVEMIDGNNNSNNNNTHNNEAEDDVEEEDDAFVDVFAVMNDPDVDAIAARHVAACIPKGRVWNFSRKRGSKQMTKKSGGHLDSARNYEVQRMNHHSGGAGSSGATVLEGPEAVLFSFRVKEKVRFLCSSKVINNPVRLGRRVGLAMAIYRRAIAIAPKTGDLRLSFARCLVDFVLEDHPSTFTDIKRHLGAAGKLSMGFDNQSLLFSITRELEEVTSSREMGSGAAFTVIEFVQYRRDRRQARVNAEKARSWIQTFWRALDAGYDSEDILSNLAARVEYFEKRASGAYERLMRRFAASPDLLRSYGSFMEEVYADMDMAERCFALADEVEDRAAEARAIAAAKKRRGAMRARVAAAGGTLSSLPNIPEKGSSSVGPSPSSSGVPNEAAITGQHGSAIPSRLRWGSTPAGEHHGSTALASSSSSAAGRRRRAGVGAGAVGGSGGTSTTLSKTIGDSSTVSAGVGTRYADLAVRKQQSRPRSVTRLLRVVLGLLAALVAVAPVWYTLVTNAMTGFEEEFGYIRLTHNRTLSTAETSGSIRSLQLAGSGVFSGLPIESSDSNFFRQQIMDESRMFMESNSALFEYENTNFDKVTTNDDDDDANSTTSDDPIAAASERFSVPVIEFIPGDPPTVVMSTRLSVWTLVIEYIERSLSVSNLTDAQLGYPLPISMNRDFRFMIDNGFRHVPLFVASGDMLHSDLMRYRIKESNRNVSIMFYVLLVAMVLFLAAIAIMWKRVIVEVGALKLFQRLPLHVVRHLLDRYATLTGDEGEGSHGHGANGPDAGAGAGGAGGHGPVPASAARGGPAGTSSSLGDGDSQGDSHPSSASRKGTIAHRRGRRDHGTAQLLALTGGSLRRAAWRSAINDKTVGGLVIVGMLILTTYFSLNNFTLEQPYTTEAYEISQMEVRIERIEQLTRELIINDTFTWSPGTTELSDLIDADVTALETSLNRILFGAPYPLRQRGIANRDLGNGADNEIFVVDLANQFRQLFDDVSQLRKLNDPVEMLEVFKDIHRIHYDYMKPTMRFLHDQVVRDGIDRVVWARDSFLLSFWIAYAVSILIIFVVFIVNLGNDLNRRSARAHHMLRLIPAEFLRDAELEPIRLFLDKNYEGARNTKNGSNANGVGNNFVFGGSTSNANAGAIVVVDAITGKITSADAAVLRMFESTEKAVAGASIGEFIPAFCGYEEHTSAARRSGSNTGKGGEGGRTDDSDGNGKNGRAGATKKANNVSVSLGDGQSTYFGTDVYTPPHERGPHFVKVISKRNRVTRVKAYKGSVQAGVRAGHVYQLLPEFSRGEAAKRAAAAQGVAESDVDLMYSLLEASKEAVIAVGKRSRRIVFLSGIVPTFIQRDIVVAESIDDHFVDCEIEHGATWSVLRAPVDSFLSSIPVDVIPVSHTEEHGEIVMVTLNTLQYAQWNDAMHNNNNNNDNNDNNDKGGNSNNNNNNNNNTFGNPTDGGPMTPLQRPFGGLFPSQAMSPGHLQQSRPFMNGSASGPPSPAAFGMGRNSRVGTPGTTQPGYSGGFPMKPGHNSSYNNSGDGMINNRGKEPSSSSLLRLNNAALDQKRREYAKQQAEAGASGVGSDMLAAFVSNAAGSQTNMINTPDIPALQQNNSNSSSSKLSSAQRDNTSFDDEKHKESDPVIIVDNDELVLTANATALSILSIPAHALIGEGFSSLLPESNDTELFDARTRSRLIGGYRKTGKSRTIVKESLVRTGNGEVKSSTIKGRATTWKGRTVITYTLTQIN